MSQEQPQRVEAVRYGDVFDVTGELAAQPIAPQDAAALQSAENAALGQTPMGGPAAVMQAAADENQRRGVVRYDQMTEAVKVHGATVSEADFGGYRVVTEAVGGQVIGQYGQPKELQATHPATPQDPDTITIGEALEATALTAGDKAIDESDAAAIQAAEVRATGIGHIIPGGIAAEAQAAAARNLQTRKEGEKTTIGDVLTDATLKLTEDKPATREDAERVISAEIRNAAEIATHPGGVSASVAAAARLNQEE